ncbi:cytochrome P450 [Caulobacter sp. 602-1]|uniref:cytochrome P450 n=1 Tax=Caulobacter sp. 602-1 TaxID=2492472 RepID=UPI000F62F8DD|nr:cytochrome P450 [Caulobacter sp. 602-1]RRN65126.1 cytochrome P450 [Caulobacter sp. 602-1]
MDLISQTVVDGVAGPGAPPTYPTLGGVDLADIFRFTKGQPWADFARMRTDAPVMWHPEPFDGPGFWALTRYEDVQRVNGDPETFSSQRGGILMSMGSPEKRHALLFRASMDTMINLDAPHHLQLRREHMPYFTPAYLRGLTERVRAEVTRLLDAMEPLLADGAEIDMVEHFSSHLPLFTLCEILGVPPEDRPKFLKWMHYLERAQDLAVQNAAAPVAPTLELMQFVQDFNNGVEEMFDYGRMMLKKRREDPQEDLMTAIARAQVDGALLADEYLDGSWLLIVFAGNDTTRNTLSGAMKLLTEFPDQKQRLISDPSLLPGAVDEFIRMVSPVIYMRRTATADVEVNGQLIREGEKVVMYYGAANRDPAMFENPDQLDVTRANAAKHIAFGYGPHTCIGKRVAQIQLEEAYRQILARFPDLNWTGNIEIAPNNFVHAISKLGVKRG